MPRINCISINEREMQLLLTSSPRVLPVQKYRKNALW